MKIGVESAQDRLVEGGGAYGVGPAQIGPDSFLGVGVEVIKMPAIAVGETTIFGKIALVDFQGPIIRSRQLMGGIDVRPTLLVGLRQRQSLQRNGCETLQYLACSLVDQGERSS